MNISEIHNWLDFITNKAQGTYFTPADKDSCLDRAQMVLFNNYYAEYAKAEKLQDALSPFKASLPFLTSDTPSGVLTLAIEYQYLLGVQVVVVDAGNTKYRPVKILSEDDLAYRLSSQLRPVTANKPVGRVDGKVSGYTIIQLYPVVPMAGTAFYLRRPIAPVYAYTQVGRVITYAPSSSVQLEWNESEINEIMVRALEFLGVSADAQTLSQYANAKAKEIN